MELLRYRDATSGDDQETRYYFHGGRRLKCLVEVSTYGWKALIFDLDQIHKSTEKPLEITAKFFDDPQAGIKQAEEMLNLYAKRLGLPDEAVEWQELCGSPNCNGSPQQRRAA